MALGDDEVVHDLNPDEKNGRKFSSAVENLKSSLDISIGAHNKLYIYRYHSFHGFKVHK